jgi:uncharacterized membrane protein YesL
VIVGLQLVGLIFSAFFLRYFLAEKSNYEVSYWQSVKLCFAVLFKFISLFAILKLLIVIILVIMDS